MSSIQWDQNGCVIQGLVTSPMLNKSSIVGGKDVLEMNGVQTKLQI